MDKSKDLILACQKGDLSLIKNLIEIENIDINCRGIIGTKFVTPLIASIFSKNIEVVKYLIEKGADINLNYHLPSVIVASTQGNLEIFKLFIENGASIDYQDSKTGLTPLLSLCQISNNNQNLEIIKYLIENKADLEKYNKDGDNALICCSKFGYTEIIHELIKGGVNINSKQNNVSKNSSLHLAVDYNQNGIVKLLLENGADINILNELNQSPLYYAIKNGNMIMIKILLERGAEIEGKDINGKSLKDIIIGKQNLDEILKILNERDKLIKDFEKLNIKEEKIEIEEKNIKKVEEERKEEIFNIRISSIYKKVVLKTLIKESISNNDLNLFKDIVNDPSFELEFLK